MPMISICPSVFTSPTIATTLLVPMSRPTKRFLSERFAIFCVLSLGVEVAAALRGGGGGRRGRAPADGKAVRIAHVHVADFGQPMRDHLRCGADEAIQALVDLTPAEPHHDT